MLKKHFLCAFLLCILLYSTSNAEKSNVFFGGGIGASFGTVTSVMVNPFVGYYILPKTAIGTSTTYQYYADNRYDASTSIYGGSLFLEQNITKEIFLRGEYEALSLETLYFDHLEVYPNDSRFIHHGILAGGGYRQQLGGGGGFFILAMVNINQTANSPYGTPILKLGFTFQ